MLFPDKILAATADELGFRVDVAGAVDGVLNAGRGSLVSIPFQWVRAFFTPYEIQLSITWRAEAAEPYIQNFQTVTLSEPKDAHVIFADDPLREGRSFQVLKGSTGAEITSEALRDALRKAVSVRSLPDSLPLEPSTIPPEVPAISLQPSVDYVNELTSDGLTLYVGDITREILPDELRSWITLVPGDPPSFSLDTERVGKILESRLAVARIQGEPGRFEIVDGVPVVTGTTQSFRCCAENIGERVLKYLRAGETNIPLTFIEDPSEDIDLIEETGIRELVGEFTTFFKPGQSRVTNIRRIGELVQGAIIAPGETWSVNEYVGPRTLEKGFVAGGVIYRGLFNLDIGGGVSQFATTTFNAAFFAGLDFGEYQAHTLYIDRYPFGREATISYPHPDLELINNTPYSVLVWPTSTEDSITVSLYSTKHMDVEQSEQEIIAQNECERVITTRTRAYYAGKIVEDTVFALYRPGEGLTCQGEPEVPPPNCAPGTAAVDTNYDRWDDSCLPICAEGQSSARGRCVPVCESGMDEEDVCIPRCGPGESDSPPGTCVGDDNQAAQIEAANGEGADEDGAEAEPATAGNGAFSER